MMEVLILLVFGIAAVIFWIWALVDVLKSDFSGYNKIIWLVVLIFLPALGVIFYFFIGRTQKKTSASPSGAEKKFYFG